jgi:hypothetical protein
MRLPPHKRNSQYESDTGIMIQKNNNMPHVIHILSDNPSPVQAIIAHSERNLSLARELSYNINQFIAREQ